MSDYYVRLHLCGSGVLPRSAKPHPPLAIVPVGYPAESPAPKNKWKTENIHYNKW